MSVKTILQVINLRKLCQVDRELQGHCTMRLLHAYKDNTDNKTMKYIKSKEELLTLIHYNF